MSVTIYTAIKNKYLSWLLLSLLVGVLAGFISGIFLIFLDIATRVRDINQDIIWLLPFAGLCIGYVYSRYGNESSKGNNLIIEEIHEPRKIVNLRIAPLVFLGTIVTHFFGGSTGREGAAVQLGATLSDQIAKYFSLNSDERRILLTAGAGAGFGASIGVPFAGMIFGMEFLAVGRLRFFALVQCFIASFTGYFVVNLLDAPHMMYPDIVFPGFRLEILLYVLLSGVIFGLSAQFFSRLTHIIDFLSQKFFLDAAIRAFVGGVIIVIFYYLEGSYRYVGLGLPYIEASLSEQSSFNDPVLKIFFTALSLGFGFKGGEFTPLVFIGVTLGSSMGLFFPDHFSLLAALGFAAVFGAASNTPLTCTIMAIELFGFGIAPYALVACYTAYYCSGHSGIYKSQRIYMKKHKRLIYFLKFSCEAVMKFLNRIIKRD
ncbi:MAG TPA: chloride channel protein [Oligoflexia bacterium]|nr:chloride channel protein [Oligoflexia bacterium]HMP49332.1 chloride channel protein [Oligoflexia bacterium]